MTNKQLVTEILAAERAGAYAAASFWMAILRRKIAAGEGES